MTDSRGQAGLVRQGDLMRQAASAGHSPCIGHCTHDAAGNCLGCCRHTDEVARWREMDATEREAIWARLPREIDKQGRGIMRLPLDADDIAELAVATLAAGGSWVAGFSGCWVKADHYEGADEGVLFARNSDAVDGGRMSLDLSGKVRAVAWAEGGMRLADLLADVGAGGVVRMPIALVTPVARLAFPVHDRPTRLEDGRLDLGLGLASVRLLEEAADRPDCQSRRVIETALVRATSKRLARPAMDMPEKPCPVPHGLDLGDAYALGALLMPRGGALR